MAFFALAEVLFFVLGMAYYIFPQIGMASVSPHSIYTNSIRLLWVSCPVPLLQRRFRRSIGAVFYCCCPNQCLYWRGHFCCLRQALFSRRR